MKKSNLLLVGALISIFIFTLIFQLAVHQNVKEEKATRKPMQMLVQNRKVIDFTSISAAGRVSIHFEQGEKSSLQINAPNYQMDSVITTVTNKILEVRLGSGLRKRDSVVIHIIGVKLDSLVLASDTYFETKGLVSGSQIYCDFRDDSSAKLNLDYDKVIYQNTSTGVVNLKGEVNNIEIKEDKNR